MKPEEAMQIAQSFARLQHLRNATIKQVADDAEIKGLLEFLAPAMLDHASEFIGCWFVMHNEYQPLIDGLMPAFRRLLATMQQQQAEQAQRAQAAQAAGPQGPPGAVQSEAEQPEPSKIVGLDGNPTNQ
jgi:hypothetical protein